MDRRTFMRRRLTAALTLALSLLLLGQSLPAPTDHPLLGKWRGNWNSNYYRGELEFTVTRVEGTRVEGIVVIHGKEPYHNQDLSFTGALEARKLTGEIPTNVRTSILWNLDLSPDGRHLTGKGYKDVWSVLTLEKVP